MKAVFFATMFFGFWVKIKQCCYGNKPRKVAQVSFFRPAQIAPSRVRRRRRRQPLPLPEKKCQIPQPPSDGIFSLSPIWRTFFSRPGVNPSDDQATPGCKGGDGGGKMDGVAAPLSLLGPRFAHPPTPSRSTGACGRFANNYLWKRKITNDK